MNNLRMKMRAYPVLASIIVMLIGVFGTNLLSDALRLLPGGLYLDILDEIVSIIAMFALVAVCGYAHVYKKRGLLRTLLVGLPHLLIFGLFLASLIGMGMIDPATQWVSTGEMAYGVLMLLAVGFREESLFRGIVVNLLAEKGMKTRRDVFRVVFLSGLLFGAIHMTNALSGVTLSSAMYQSISAFAGGCLFGALYLRGGSLWGVMLLHSLMDSVGLFETLFFVGGDTTEALNMISSSVLFMTTLFLLITLFLIRKSGCRKIIALRAREFGEA